jgi:hypothetical protein
LKPSPEAVAWGKRQASNSPRWTDAKWSKISTIFGLELVADDGQDQRAEATTGTDTLRDAA